MFSLKSDKTQYAILPLTFSDQNGEVNLPQGSLKVEVTGGTGATAEIVEVVTEGKVSFAVKLVPGPTASTYRFLVSDNTPDGDNLKIDPLDIEYLTTEESIVTITAGTPEFRPKSELPTP